MSKMSTMGSVSGPMPALAQAQAMGGRRRRGKWLWLLASVALIFVLGGLGFFGWGLWAYANHDHIDQIDDPQVVAIVESACATMTRSDGSEKSTSMPNASRLKSSMTLNKRKLLPSSSRSCMKSIDQTLLIPSGTVKGWGFSRTRRLRGWLSGCGARGR